MTKSKTLTVAGLAAIFLVVATIAMTASEAGSELSACDANTRGKVYQWARLHPGMNRTEECLKLGNG